MRGKLWITGLAVAVVGVTFAGTTMVGASESDRITVWEHSTSVTLTPRPTAPGPPAVGSTLVVYSDIFSDQALTHRIGVNHIVCTFATPTGASVCTAVLELTGRGQIMTQVLSTHPNSFDGAIVGGTGEFRKASGAFYVRNINPQTHTEQTTFDLH